MTRRTQTLTPAESRFVDRIILGDNQSDAWRHAHPLRASRILPGTLYVNAHKLIRANKIQRALSSRREASASRAAVNQDRVLTELARLSFADITDYARLVETGELDAADLPPGAAAAISEVTVETYVDGRGEDAREVRRVRVKLHPKMAALEALSKHLGLFAPERVDGDLIPDTGPVRELTVRELRDGIRMLREVTAPALSEVTVEVGELEDGTGDTHAREGSDDDTRD